MKKILVVLVALVLSGCGGTGKRYWTYGTGNAACSDWDAFNTHHPSDVRNWLNGWVSAAGYYEATELEEINYEIKNAWVGHYCKKNPSAKIKDGAVSLVDKIKKGSDSDTDAWLLPILLNQ